MQKKGRNRTTYTLFHTNPDVCRQKTNDLPTENNASNHTKHTICRGKTYDLPGEKRRFPLDKARKGPRKGMPAFSFYCKHFDTPLAVSRIQKIVRTDGNGPPSGRKEAILSQQKIQSVKTSNRGKGRTVGKKTEAKQKYLKKKSSLCNFVGRMSRLTHKETKKLKTGTI